jgi:hypothetical protein
VVAEVYKSLEERMISDKKLPKPVDEPDTLSPTRLSPAVPQSKKEFVKKFGSESDWPGSF